MSRIDPDDPFEQGGGVRVTEIEIGGERLVVLSHPLDAGGDPSLRSALTPAEADVATLACAGLSNAEIAERRGSSVRTVANQIAAILRKAGVASRRELAARWAARAD